MSFILVDNIKTSQYFNFKKLKYFKIKDRLRGLSLFENVVRMALFPGYRRCWSDASDPNFAPFSYCIYVYHVSVPW